MERNYIVGVRMKEPPPPGSYLNRLPMVEHLLRMEQLAFSAPVTFLVGENGTGKSTLLEAIAVASGFNAEGGSRDFSFSTRDSHSELYRCLTIIRTTRPDDGFFLRAESFYNAASYLEETRKIVPGDYRRYGGISPHEQSHGEAFLSLISNRFEGHGLYLLDEPEAALSPRRLMSLLCCIDDLVKMHSQFIIATHSPILMAYPNARILEFTEEGIQEVGYRETEHYRLTKRFLDDPERMMRYLLE